MTHSLTVDVAEHQTLWVVFIWVVYVGYRCSVYKHEHDI